MENQKNGGMRPTFRTWIKHIILFLLTFLTATTAGVFFPFGHYESPLFLLASFFDSTANLIYAPAIFSYLSLTAIQIVFSNSELLAQGLQFSIPLLFILAAHEFGHYIACRIYGADATLPYFLPVPLLSPAGTLGAFIKILSPMPSRRVTFDIAVAGPIAGFIALIPVAIFGLLSSPTLTAEQPAASQTEITFAKPLLLVLFAQILNTDLNLLAPNGIYFAAWLGLLITSLNLIPAGYFDGGHTVFAVFGGRFHALAGRIAFVLMLLITLAGVFVYNTPSGILFTILLGVMLKLHHPEPSDSTPLDFKRKVIAAATLLVFVLSFMPFPIKVATSLFEW